MMMMKELLWVFVGGGLGSVLRYGVSLLQGRPVTDGGFPWATLSVNVVGCLLIGALTALCARQVLGNDLRLLLVVGLCGGFTTFSTFGNEALTLIRNGAWGMAAAYVLISVLGGLLAVALGSRLLASH